MTLTQEQEATLIRLLQMCEPGKMSMALFLEFCRLLPMIAIEVVTLRRAEDNVIEVLLTQRPENDPHFAGEWHSPGTILRVTDFEPIMPGSSVDEVVQFSRATERLAKSELGTMLGVLEYAGIVMQPSPRGPHLHVVLVNPQGVGEGSFFRVDQLPEPFMVAHCPVLELALQKFYSLR